MKNHGLWVAHRAYRKAFGRSMVVDAINGVFLEPPDFYRATRSIAEVANQCAYRFMRRHRLNKVSDYLSLIERIVDRCSGNTAQTMRAIRINTRNLNRKVAWMRNANGVYRPSAYPHCEANRARATTIIDGMRQRKIAMQAAAELVAELDANRCHCCGSLESKKGRKGNQLFDVFDDDWKRIKVCAGCRERLRHLGIRQDEADEIKNLTRQLKRTLKHGSQEHNRARSINACRSA
jgi:hypothetical protein